MAEERGVAVKMCSPERTLSVHIDAMRLKQVVVNLVVNAVQASPEGEMVTVQCHSNGRDLVIEVVDHGPGIPPEKRDEVFTPFYTTKKEGTGLGLAIVRKIVDAHGGRIRIVDNPDKGVTFRIEVPMILKEPGKGYNSRQAA
jgi:signal transduction histidine kinase